MIDKIIIKVTNHSFCVRCGITANNWHEKIPQTNNSNAVIVSMISPNVHGNTKIRLLVKYVQKSSVMKFSNQRRYYPTNLFNQLRHTIAEQ